MLGFGKKDAFSTSSLACFLSDSGYSLVGLSDAKTVRFCQNNFFSEPSPQLMASSLATHVQRYDLYGAPCYMILSPSLYQLHLMDTPQVPEDEIAKALRWQLKGLIDYPLNDVAVDAFLVPPHGVGMRRKKVFAAITLQSALLNKIAFIEQSLLKVAGVSIAEMSLNKLLSHVHLINDNPYVVVSFDEHLCQLHLFCEHNLYLSRTLVINETIIYPNSPARNDILLEIQRSIDYCLTELKLPEPKHIVFTPNFYRATDLFEFLNEALQKKVILMDMNAIFPNFSISPEDMATAFYAFGGALISLENRS